MAQAYLLNKIINVLGLSVKKREVLSDDGYSTIFTTILWKYYKICEWCTTKAMLTTTRGGASYGYQKIKCLQTLEWWDTNLTLRGKHMVLADIDATMITYCIDEAKLDYDNGNKEPDIKKPYKFSYFKWVAW